MCTVTLVPRPDGFRLAVNRDELRARPAAETPHVRRHGERQAIYPIDPPSGGTWVAVNDAGVAFTLLNRTVDGAPPRPDANRSRGEIIPALLGADRATDAWALLEQLGPADFTLFRLLIVDAQNAVVARHEGDRFTHTVRARPNAPMMLTSSGLGDAVVEPPRRALFDSWFGGDARDWADQQRAFHRHAWPDRRPLSVNMSRDDARTVSCSFLDVTARRVEMRYAPWSEAHNRGQASEPPDSACRLALARAVAHPDAVVPTA